MRIWDVSVKELCDHSFPTAPNLPDPITPVEEQRRLLAEKDCPCPIEKEVLA